MGIHCFVQKLFPLIWRRGPFQTTLFFHNFRLCRDKFEGIKDELEKHVNEECYKALQAILPGYDYARLEDEKKLKGKKSGNANPLRKSNRQNDEAESEVCINL